MALLSSWTTHPPPTHLPGHPALKILKVEYLSNPLLDRTQILNLGLDDQTMFYKNEDDLQWRTRQNI